MEHTLEYVTIGVYLAFLLGISIYVSRINQSVSDYVRGGGQAAWWLVGSSAFMSSISAYTFTGNGSLRCARVRARSQRDLHRALDSADRGSDVGRYHPAAVRSRG